LLERWDIDAGYTFVGGDRECAQLARLDLRGEFAESADARGDVAAHDGRLGLTAAGVSDVVDLCRLDARGLRDHAGEDVIGAAGGTSAPCDAAGIRLELGDQFL